MRIVFAGTPEVAAVSLRALLDSRHEVVAVVTRPDAPAGRGRGLVRSAVAELADTAGIEVLAPVMALDDQFVTRLRELAPRCCPVVAYGSLLPAEVLSVPTLGWVNLHFSLLPAYRGAAPVQAAIAAGERITGATTFVLDQGMDTGPVLSSVTEPIGVEDTAGDLLSRLALSGAGLLVRTLDALEEGSIQALPQDDALASYAPKITVEDARIDWSSQAAIIDRTIRACTPEPGAWTMLGADRIKVGPVHETAERLPIGQLRVEKTRVLVGTATGAVQLSTVQAPGKRPMPAADWARGVRGLVEFA